MSQPEGRTSVRQVAMNEVVGREANERVDPPTEAGWDLSLVDRDCECGYAACRARLRLTVAEYEELRRDGRRFAIVHEHVVHAAERVVERRERYSVVEKLAEAAAIAEAHDPRG